MMIAASFGVLVLPVYMLLATLTMFTFGLMISNFTALAMEPLGHIAGTASSLYGSITTLIGIVLGTAIGQSYNGTMIPLGVGFFICSVLALVSVLVTERAKMFRPSKQATK
jgi:DHA1 family bicyclomycin/chloramphenicol resistance-like MFS transporter